MQRHRALALSIVLLAGCNALTGADELIVGDGEQSNDGSGAGLPSGTATSGPGGPGAGGAGGGSVPVPTDDATGVSIREVSFYQAVKSNVVVAASPVAPSVDLVAGRPAIVRVFVDVAAPSGAPVTARLILGANPPLEVTMTPTQSSSEEVGASTFNIEVPAAYMTTGLSYRVELREPVASSAGPNAGATVPAPDQLQPVAVRTTGPVRITLIPVRYGNDGSDRMPDTSAGQLQAYEDLFFAMYPVTGAEIVVGPTLDWDGYIGPGGDGWESLLNTISNERTSSNADFDEFYYGIFRPTGSVNEFCGGGCVAGLGFVGDPNGEYSRAAIGLGYAGEMATMTAAHEVGHNHGRPHSPCGGVSGADPNYPHAGGSIGVWGLDLNTAQLKSPSAYRDIMGYCEPNWISDYVYEEILDFSAQIHGAALSFPPDMLGREWERISVGDAGASFLPHVRMTRPPLGATRDVEVELADGTVKTVHGVYYAYDHLPGGVLLVAREASPIRRLAVEVPGGASVRTVTATR